MVYNYTQHHIPIDIVVDLLQDTHD